MILRFENMRRSGRCSWNPGQYKNHVITVFLKENIRCIS